MGWENFGEVQQRPLSAESRFELRKRTIGLFLGPFAFLFAVFLLPHHQDITLIGMRTLGIFAWVVLWWVTEPIPIPVTGLFGLALLALCGVFPVSRAFSSLGHWVVLFSLGALIIAQAMTVNGLTRRFAYRMISFNFIRGRPWRLLSMFLVGTVILSSIVSDFVATVIFMAIGAGLLKALDIPPGSRFGEMFILSTAWAALYGGMITPVGTPPNLIAIGLVSNTLNYQIGFASWSLVGIPMAILGITVMLTVLRFSLKDELGKIKIDSRVVRGERRKIGSITRGEKIVGFGLLTAIVFWLAPDFSTAILGADHPVSLGLHTHLNVSVVALLVATSMFLIPINWREKQFPLTWKQAASGVDWGTLLLVAGALGIGEALADPSVGVGRFLSSALDTVSGPGTSPFFPLVVITLFMVFIANLISNTAAMGIVGPIVLVIASAPGSTLNPIAAIIATAMASSMSFMLPCSTPATAIVFSSGYVRILTMFRKGFILAVTGVVISTFVAYTLANLVFPWPN